MPIDLQLAEDRALRDAAKRLLDADIAFIREDLGQRSAPGRVADRAADAALDTADDALDYARTHQTLLITAGVVIAAWFARSQIAQLFGQMKDKAEDAFR